MKPKQSEGEVVTENYADLHEKIIMMPPWVADEDAAN